MNTKEQAEFSEKLYQAVKSCKAWANGDRIPIRAFEIIESDLRVAMRTHGVRATFRGPRRSNVTSFKPGRTCRKDAKFVSIWYAAE